MTYLNNAGVDLAGLRKLYKNDKAARAFLDDAAGRKKNMGKTSVERTLKLLNQGGHGLSRRDVIRVFQKLEEVRCGTFVVGRRGRSPRFQSGVSLVSIRQAATGETQEIEPLSEEEASA